MNGRDWVARPLIVLTILTAWSEPARANAIPSPISIAAEEMVGDATDPYNVIFYVVDTWRADHVGLYGYPRDTTPFIDSIAEEGVAWSGCRAASTWTWPSVVSLMTGLTLFTHKALERPLAVHPGWTTLSEILEMRGYSTQLITSNALLDWPGRTGDLYQQVIATDRPDRNLHEALDAALRDESIRPFFIHAQPYGPHTPYETIAPFDSLFVNDEYYGALGDVPTINYNKSCTGGISIGAVIDGITSMDWYVSQYDGLIAYMDYLLSQTFEVLEEEGLRENTIIVITSDHGEELAGEHDRYFCHWEHYEGNTRIPLIMLLPEKLQREHGPYRDIMLDGHVGLVDVMPTVLDILKIPVPIETQGRSLARFPEPLRAVASDQRGRTYMRDSYKVINRSMTNHRDPDVELYNLELDPGETNNLSESEPLRVEFLENELLQVAAATDQVFPSWAPSGVLHENNFDSPIETARRYVPTDFSADAFFDFAVIMDPDSNRVLHGKVAPQEGDGLATENFRVNCPLIFPPYTSYSAEADIQLVSGKAAMQICYSDWASHGYLATFTENEVTLIRMGRDGTNLNWGRISFPFGHGQWRRVQFMAQDSVVRLSIDGEPVIEATENRPGSLWGTTYFAVASTGGEVFVDNLKIEK